MSKVPVLLGVADGTSPQNYSGLLESRLESRIYVLERLFVTGAEIQYLRFQEVFLNKIYWKMPQISPKMFTVADTINKLGAAGERFAVLSVDGRQFFSEPREISCKQRRQLEV